MEMTDGVYHLIKNTPKVTAFPGADNKATPGHSCSSPLSLDRVREQVIGAGRNRSSSRSRHGFCLVRFFDQLDLCAFGSFVEPPQGRNRKDHNSISDRITRPISTRV